MNPKFKFRFGICYLIITSLIVFASCEKENGSEPLDPSPINGVSSAYVNLADAGVSIDEYTTQGRLVLSIGNKVPDVRKGSIIAVDLDTMGYLRRVMSVNTEGDKMYLETSRAYLNDVFVDKDFKLNTALLEPDQIVSLKSIESNGNEAIMGKDGQIHPSEIVLYDDKGIAKVITAADLKTSKADTITLLYFNEDFSGKDLYGTEGDDFHFYISEGYVELGSNAIFEFDFNSNGEYDQDTQVERGELFKFAFYLNSNADFKTKLEFDATSSIIKDGEKRLYKFNRITAKFIVSGVPVWISLDASIWSAYTFESEASLHADWGFESSNKLQVGGMYEGTSNSFTPINNYEAHKSVYPLNIEAKVNIESRLELYPRVDVLFYGFFGPFAEIVPFIEGSFNAAFQTQIFDGGSETFLAWNSGIDLGLDIRVGAKLDFIGKAFDEEFGPKVINCFKEPLWYTPASIEQLSFIPTECPTGTSIPLSFVVKDNLGNGVNLCPIMIDGNGSFSDALILSDQDGHASTTWILNENSTGLKEFSAIICESTKEIINQVKGQTNEVFTIPSIIFNPNVTYGTFTDTRDNNVYRTLQLGDQVWMAENLRYLSRVNPPWNNNGYWVYGYEGTDLAEAKATANYYTYGVLYNLNQALNACPAGWHLPSDQEWTKLENYLITSGYNYDSSTTDDKIAKALASSYGWETSAVLGAVGNSDFSDKRNATGFTGLPAGIRLNEGGKFSNAGINTTWWSSTHHFSYILDGKTITSYYYRSLRHDYTYLVGGGNSGFLIENGVSVRCIKN